MLGMRQLTVGLTLLTLAALPNTLCAQDILEQKRQEEAIKAQQIVSDANAAIEKSRELEKANATQAKSLLERNLLQVNDASALGEKERADIRDRLRIRLREVDASVREQRDRDTQAAKLAADKAAREERDRIAKGQGGKQSTFDQANDKINSTNKAREDQSTYKKMQSNNAVAIWTDIEKSVAQGQKEQRITKTFVEAGNRRMPKLTGEETALLKALNSTISVDFEKTPLKFKEFLEFLSEKTGISVIPDKGSMDDAGVQYDTDIVPFKVPKATVRTILKKVLADLKLTYIIEKGNIQVITPDHVKEHLVTRAYPVGDLITPINTQQIPPLQRKFMMGQQAMQLIQTIVNTIEPGSWQGVGQNGFGTISYNEITMSIVITHTAELHYSLGGALGR
jgi:hypothetical protein